MVQTTPTHVVLEQGPAIVRALRSLTRRDTDAVRAAIRAAGGEWTLEEHDDYDGYLSLLIAPAQICDRAPAYLIAGRTDAVELAALRGDEMIALGSFPSIGAATTVLRHSLASWSWAVDPAAAAKQRSFSAAEAASIAEQLVERHGNDAGLHAAMRADEGDGEREGWHAVLRAIENR